MRSAAAKISKRAAKPAPRVRVRQAGNPWTDFAGIWKDDPGIDDFLKEVAKLRKQRDKDANS
jgi:hypothetical protein